MPTAKTGAERARYAAYQRFFASRNKWNLYRARLAGGLDLTTGWKPVEIVRYSELEMMAREALYQSLLAIEKGEQHRRHDIMDDFNTVRNEINHETSQVSVTAEYRDMLNELGIANQQAMLTWVDWTNTPAPPIATEADSA